MIRIFLFLAILGVTNCVLNPFEQKKERDYSDLLSYLIQSNSGNGSTTGGSTEQNSGAIYNLGGSVTGLGLSSTLILQNNLSDIHQIFNNGVFRFTKLYKAGENYSVTVFSQPQSQTCTVVAGLGAFSSSDVYSIFVNCQ